VGATTSNAYAEYIAADASISRLFQKVQSVTVSSADDTNDQKAENEGNENGDSNDTQFKGRQTLTRFTRNDPKRRLKS